MNSNKYILFVDGVCNLCNNLVRFVFNFDSNSTILFAPLKGNTYEEIKKKISFPENEDTVILYSINENIYFTKSEAIQYLLFEMRFFKIFGYFFYLFPKKLRNSVYNLVAKTRYKIFGKSEYCKYKYFVEDSRFLE